MKLISLHINAYGKLSNFDYTFSNVSTFCEENGFGKSTIASFIKAMLYGLETIKTGGKFNDRMHFYPFTGGNFGGNLIFEYKSHTYRIERVFDKKSETKDSMVVYKDNNLTDELGPIPGVTIFGINKESFERLILITADKITIETDNDINKKLNNYVENVGEEFDIDAVLKSIKASKKEKTDISKKTKEQIKSLESDIHNLTSIKEDLENKYAKLNQLNKEKNDAVELYDKASRQGTLAEKWKTYDNMISECEIKKSNIVDILAKYSNEIPKLDKINEIKSLMNQIKIYDASLENDSISLEQKNEYERLMAKYSNHLPDNNELEIIEEKINQYEALNKQIDDLSNVKKSERELELEKHFFGETISSEELETFEKQVGDHSRLERELSEITPTVMEVKKGDLKPNQNNRKTIVIAIASSIAFIGAGIGLSFVHIVLGISLIALGVLLICFAMFSHFNSSIKNIKQEEHIEAINPLYEQKKKDIDKQYNIIVNHFANYRYNGDNPELLLYQMKRDSLEYDNILKEKEQNKSLIENASFQSLELSNELNSFFNLISMQELPYKKAIDIIKRDIATINTLSSIIKEYSINKQEIKNKMEEATKTVDDFYKSIKVSKDIAIDQINQDVLDYQRINDEYLALEKKANEYKRVNNLQERIENVEYDMDNLKDDMDKKNSMYNNLKLEIEELEDRTSALDDKIISLTNLKEEKELADKKAKMLEALMNELGNADQILKDKYVAPIKDKFCEYAIIIEEAIGKNVSMDKNYKISFDREGALRSSEHLSSGILAICALCFRLALLDNMFEDEKPFLIMDDPFVSLDEAHIKKAKDLMEILASDKQIIYFCCHESRKI